MITSAKMWFGEHTGACEKEVSGDCHMNSVNIKRLFQYILVSDYVSCVAVAS